MTRKLRFIYAISSGLILSLAWAQWMNSLILLVALVPLLLLEDHLFNSRKSYKSVNVFLYSLISFGIWNMISTWWIWNASPFGMFAAVILNTVLMSLVFWLFHLSRRNMGSKAGYFLLIFYWVAYEYFHLNWDLSWSWLNIGNGFGKDVMLVQWYEYTGILGGTFWVMVSNVLITVALRKYTSHNSIKSVYTNSTFLLLWIAVPIGISIFRFYSYTEKENPQRIVVIQPNIDPYTEKFDGLTDEQQLNKILNLADSLNVSDVDYFVAPETALPKSMREGAIKNSRNYRTLKEFTSKYPKSSFVIGLSSYKVYKSKEKPTVTARPLNKKSELFYDNFNSALQVDNSANFQLYHKSKLVPGVEKMPFPKTLSFLEDFALDLGGTMGSLGSQDDRQVFYNSNNGRIKVAPVICYESIFGDYLTYYIKNGANMIFVITNDAWWGDTPGYKQHLRFAQLRAIETRRSVARSANTGISCFINQKGELIQPTEYNTDAALVAEINANDVITFYVRYRDYLGRIFSFVAVLGLFATLSGYLRREKEVIPS